MPAPITTLRASLASVLANNNVWNTYSFPPPTITANSCIVAPADSYITPSNNTNVAISPLANLKIIMTCPMLDNQGNLADIEEFMVAVVNKLADSNLNYRVSNMSAPMVLGLEQGQMLSAELSVSIVTEWS